MKTVKILLDRLCQFIFRFHPIIANIYFILIIIVTIINFNNGAGENGLLFYFAFLWLTAKLNILSYVGHFYALFCEFLCQFFNQDISLFLYFVRTIYILRLITFYHICCKHTFNLSFTFLVL